MDNLVFISLTAVIAFAVIFLLRKGHRQAKRSAELSAEIEDLRAHLNTMRETRNRFASFLMKVTDAIGFLSSNIPHAELISSIIRLVKDVISTDFVGLYLYDRSSESLRLVSSFGEIKNVKKIYLMGEGMPGATAKKKVLFTRDHYSSDDEPNSCDRSPDTVSVTSEVTEIAWIPDITAPILYKDDLLGVISIGRISASDGNEKAYLSMIAALAGISLRNAVFIDSAKHEANTDGLTGIYSRRFLLQMAAEELARARGYGYPFSLFMFDLDNFKNYNDRNGHGEGDSLLLSLTELVKKVTRMTSLFGRYGGEEFIVLLPNIDKENALIYANRVRELVQNYPFRFRESQPLGFISISGGVAVCPSDGDTVSQLIQAADAALYDAKRKGKNRIAAYSDILRSGETTQRDEQLTEGTLSDNSEV